MTKPSAATARQKLQLSKLRPQLELMGRNVELEKVYLALGRSTVNIRDAILEARIRRTIEGASTVTLTIEDRDFNLLNSGRLSARNDIEIDGLFFRLVGVAISGQTLTLTFEDREIAVLRTYSRPIKQSLSTSRGKLTRAQFILRMLQEVKEFKIPYRIPELDKVQPIGNLKAKVDQPTRNQNRNFGIPKNTPSTVQNAKMDETQRANANICLDTATSMVVPRKFMVMEMMCAIQESRIQNLPQPIPGDGNYLSADPTKNPVGVFQQIKHWGWPASRDIATDAQAFLTKLIGYVKDHPQANYADAIEGIQNSGFPRAYAQWRTEAEFIVTEYGLGFQGSAAANAQFDANLSAGDYEFYRGIPPTVARQNKKGQVGWLPEDSWSCFSRLASEVQWRSFFVSGTYYLIADNDLFGSQPIASVDHSSRGIMDITGDYDEGKKTASLTLDVQMGRWVAPPGSVVQVRKMGPWNGRWIVNDVERSAFEEIGTITLKKPLPRLPEPGGTNVVNSNIRANWTTPTGAVPTIAPGVIPTGTAVEIAKTLVDFLDNGQLTDNSGDIRTMAQYGAVTNMAGQKISIDARVLKAVLYILQNTPGTGLLLELTAMCSNHSPLTSHGAPSAHGAGRAVDLGGYRGTNFGRAAFPDTHTKANAIALAKMIRGMSAPLYPAQLICGGYNNHRDDDISKLSVPAADSFYGGDVMQQHTDHEHLGY